MSHSCCLCWFLIFTSMILHGTSESASAQFEALPAEARPGTVSGTGNSSIEKKPNVMRMHIELMAKAGTLKEAIRSLKTRRESARKTIEKLGVETESIAFGEVSISDVQSEQQQQLAEMMAMIDEQRERIGRPNAKKTSVPVTVTCSLTADWKLDFDSSEELLLFVHPLQQEIRTADISGAEDASALSPEQQEMLEEMQGEYGMMDYYGSGEQEPGTPVFTYIATISEEEHAKALAEAYQQAKADASRLSKATGAELGKLVSVSSNTSPGAEQDDSSYYEQQYYYSQMMQPIGVSQSASENEAIGYKPGTVSKQITVTAWFDFKD